MDESWFNFALSHPGCVPDHLKSADCGGGSWGSEGCSGSSCWMGWSVWWNPSQAAEKRKRRSETKTSDYIFIP